MCEEDENQNLVWMDSDRANRLKADRAAAEAEAARAAAEAELEAQRLAAEQEAAAAEAQRLANEQAAAAAAAAEAQRLAEEQARQAPPAPVPAPPPAPPAYFKNCDAARAAGAAPVYVGQPGYGRHLDRDGDGIGCE